MSASPGVLAQGHVPAAASSWRLHPRWKAGRAWPWWLAAVLLHAALLAAILLRLEPRALMNPRILEGTPLVWEGPVGAGEGAPELSPDLPSPPPAPESPAPPAEAPAPPVPATPPAAAAASPESPAPQPAEPPPPPAEAIPPPAVSPPVLPPAARPAPGPNPPAPAANALPLPPPPAPPPPVPVAPTPARPAAAAPLRTVEVPVAPGAIRLGAGTFGTPGESRTVGAPQPGCQDVIGYPVAERQRGVIGAVGLRLRVSDDGRVVEARIVEPSGSSALDEAAQRGVRRCRFVPALRDGLPVWGTRDYRVVFQLN